MREERSLPRSSESFGFAGIRPSISNDTRYQISQIYAGRLCRCIALVYKPAQARGPQSRQAVKDAYCATEAYQSGEVPAYTKWRPSEVLNSNRGEMAALAAFCSSSVVVPQHGPVLHALGTFNLPSIATGETVLHTTQSS